MAGLENKIHHNQFMREFWFAKSNSSPQMTTDENPSSHPAGLGIGIHPYLNYTPSMKKHRGLFVFVFLWALSTTYALGVG